MIAFTAQSSPSSSGFVAVTNSSQVVALPLLAPSVCSFHSFHPNPHSAPLKSTKEEKRAISLDVFLDSDKFSMIVDKKHRSIVNDVLFPELQEDVEESSWKCFGNNQDCNEDAVQVKEQPKSQKENVDEDKKKKDPVVKLTIYTPSSISTRHFKIYPSKTDEKTDQCSKDQKETAATAPPSLPFCIDTSIPPPSFLTPPTSGPSSPSPTIEKPSFVFNMGVVNAPKPGVKTAKKKLMENGDTFEMYVDTSKPKKVKIFSPEEIKKQSSLVDEWKRRIQDSL